MDILLELNGADPFNISTDQPCDVVVVNWDDCREDMEACSATIQQVLDLVDRTPALIPQAKIVLKDLFELMIKFFD